MYALPTTMFSPESDVSIVGGTTQSEELWEQFCSENIQLYGQCVPHPRWNNSNLFRITLPALAYGASLSGTTIVMVTITTVPSLLVKATVTITIRWEELQIGARIFPPPFGRV